MTLSRITRLLAPASLLASLAFTGCSTVKLDSTGETAAVYQLNEFSMLLNTTAPRAYAATQKAFKDMDLFETKSKLQTFEAELNARSRKDENVHVDISEVNSRQTLLKIRWSATGDKKNSKALYDLIERNLR